MLSISIFYGSRAHGRRVRAGKYCYCVPALKSKVASESTGLWDLSTLYLLNGRNAPHIIAI